MSPRRRNAAFFFRSTDKAPEHPAESYNHLVVARAQLYRSRCLLLNRKYLFCRIVQDLQYLHTFAAFFSSEFSGWFFHILPSFFLHVGFQLFCDVEFQLVHRSEIKSCRNSHYYLVSPIFLLLCKMSVKFLDVTQNVAQSWQKSSIFDFYSPKYPQKLIRIAGNSK